MTRLIHLIRPNSSRASLAAIAFILVTSSAGCSCAEGYPTEVDGSQNLIDAATDARPDAIVEAGSDAAGNAEAGMNPDSMVAETCGNGSVDEFEICDPMATGVTDALRCQCGDEKACTLDRCKPGTSAATCDCVCENPVDSEWVATVCDDGLACTLDNLAHYDSGSPTNPATCDAACGHALDGNWLAGRLATCTSSHPACLAFSSNAFTYKIDSPTDPSTCDANCHFTLDQAWLATTCNDADACTTEAPSFLQDATTIEAAGACTNGVAYTCNRHDTRTDEELCNGLDDDCDAAPDDGCPTGVATCCSTNGTPFGGSGGDAYAMSCPAGSVLVGFDGRSGARVDQLTPVCAPVAVVPVAGTPERSYVVTLGASFTSGTVGGTGGSVFSERCGANQVVTGITGNAGSRVSRFGFTCGSIGISHVVRSWILAIAGAGSSGTHGDGAGAAFSYACPAGTLGIGIAGRAADEVDQVSLTCATPSISGVENVAYELVARHSGACADVFNFSQDNGGAVVQWACSNGTNQQWEMRSSNDGYVTFVAKHSGRCLDVTAFATNVGASMEQYECWTGGPQRFSVQDLGNGYHRIVAQISGLCLGVNGGASSNGATVIQTSCGPASGDFDQQWALRKVP